MINVIHEIKTQSRMFSEPPEPKPSIKDQFELVNDSMQTIVHEMRRLENRMALLRCDIEKAQVGK